MSLSDNVQVVGRAKDGVRILRQVAKPTHFTHRQIAAIVRKVKHGREH